MLTVSTHCPHSQYPQLFISTRPDRVFMLKVLRGILVRKTPFIATFGVLLGMTKTMTPITGMPLTRLNG